MSGPPLWQVSGSNAASVFLYGTVVESAMTRESASPALEAALAECRTVWCEFPPTTELAGSSQLATHGLSNEPLSIRLDDELERRLTRGCAHLGVDRAALEPMRPWLAAQIIDGAHGTACDIDPSTRIEAFLDRCAADVDVSLHFEYATPEAAFGLFSTLETHVELDYLSWTLDRSVHAHGTCTGPAHAWRRGSLAELTDETIRFVQTYPELFRVLVTSRNRSWVNRISAMLTTGETTVVVVGAGHLVGDGGIPSLLQQNKISLRRMDTSTPR
ncbi:TraB/GumN family protein [Ilumatobacter sp.]|uniref:TraB/GumN family protein n=1 Tax=Ilumatobacter sp. TaxID=1967498 RepID=UPI003C39F0B7